MNTKLISERALSVIDQYEHFKVGNAVCSVPYFNNKVTRARASLRVLVGKGSPKDIYDETMSLLIKNHVDTKLLSGEMLKKALVESNVGIDCSGFAYHILNTESQERKKGPLDKNIHFVNCRGIISKMRCALRPVENCDVATLAHDKNSNAVQTKDIQPGDIITMMGGPEGGERDHILVVYQIEYQNFVPTKLHYVHAMAYPTDGIYGTGIKRGLIQILDASKGITEQLWSENGVTGDDLFVLNRAKKSDTNTRRLILL